VVHKKGHYIIGDKFVKCEQIFTIFAPSETELNFKQDQCNISHFTLTLVPHYLEKFITDYVMSCFFMDHSVLVRTAHMSVHMMCMIIVYNTIHNSSENLSSHPILQTTGTVQMLSTGRKDIAAGYLNLSCKTPCQIICQRLQCKRLKWAYHPIVHICVHVQQLGNYISRPRQHTSSFGADCSTMSLPGCDCDSDGRLCCSDFHVNKLKTYK